MTSALVPTLSALPVVYVRQKRELAELVGFETRNKYALTTEQGAEIGFVAEQQKGLLGTLLRQFLGHWRTFEVHFFDAQRQLFMRAVHPFRFFFQRLEVLSAKGDKLGAVQQRFAIFSKRFEVEDAQGRVVLTVSSPFFRLWTFPFKKGAREVARIEKRWTGLLAEAFTDKDTFRVSFGELESSERLLVLAAAIFVDLQYFERKAD